MILKGRYASPPIPDQDLVTFVRSAFATFGDRVALTDGPTGRSYTFRQVLDLSASIAHGLRARGIQTGDRIAFITPNAPEVAFAFHGAIAAGAVAMMLNPLSTRDELIRYFHIGRPKIAITVPALVPGIRAAAPELPVIAIGNAESAEPLAALLDGPTTPPSLAIDPDAVAVMPYSSGTTGFPKGVMLTHRNIVAQCLSLAAVTDAALIVPEGTAIAVLPFFHIYGITAFLTYGLSRGARIITMPRFDLAEYVKLVGVYKPPLLHVVPPILLGLAKFPGDLALPGVQAALVAAAPLSESLAQTFTQRTGVAIYQAYGMTEVSGASHIGSSLQARNKPGSIGGLIGGAEARIVSVETGADVTPGERGEVWVRAPFVMRGYFENEAATAETIDGDGWLHTGDIAHVDADGDFWIVDRVKELIKYKAFQIAPAELEAVVLQHPSVADCAVYPQADEEAGEIPKASVVLKPNATLSEVDLIEFVAGHVNPQKRLRAVQFVDAIPKSASGKILRRLLVQRS